MDALELESAKQSPAIETAKDLFSGAVGGIAQVLIAGQWGAKKTDLAHDKLTLHHEVVTSIFVQQYEFNPIANTLISGQPFDIVKVRLQTTTQYSSAINAATTIYKNEGALAFYKGTLTPLIGIGACVSVQFGAFNAAKRWFQTRNNGAELSYPQYGAAGAFAGVSNSVLSGPIEHIRIRLQSQPHGAGRLYDGPGDCIRKLGAHNGVLSGIYRGQAVTIWREAFAYGSWFTAFEYMMNSDAARNKIDRKDIPAYKIALYGGLAGEVLWLSSYPFDVIKSKMQTDGFGANQKYATMRDCFSKTWRAEGAAGFWKGIGPTLARAMPVSAGTFIVVEMTMRALNS
ncbi:solute carrier family member 46 [Fusarium denticulatum]|uniref:Solute carrier family member 46 n=1 Tax=Fusarium denticulatum TaxID=48507 RepID=A0A8H5U6U3_9HYPO|nr:solute carrier family member 46 [Fusarium denticulatum]